MEVVDGLRLQVMPHGWTIGKPTKVAFIVAALMDVRVPTWVVRTYASTIAPTSMCTSCLCVEAAITERMHLTY